MFRAQLLLLLSRLPSILCSCFTQVPWTTSRQVLSMIDPCLTIDNCESACLGNSQCVAYAFVNMRCALLGADSGRAQVCTSANPVCYVRTAACDAVTTTSAAPTTTTTSTPAISTTTTPATTTTTTIVSCKGLTYAVPSTSTGCVPPDFGDTQVSCAAGYDLYELGAGDAGILMLGPLNCIGGEWTDGADVVSANTAMYCQPQQPATTTTTTTAATSTTTAACPPQSYDVPASCGGCMWPAFDSVQTSCQPGYDLFTFDTATQTSTQIGWPLECVQGDWRDGPTVIPAGTNMYCKPKPVTTSTATTPTTTSVCSRQPYQAPGICGGCLSNKFNGTHTYCLPGYDLYSFDNVTQTSVLMGGPLVCSGVQWMDGAAVIPAGTNLYCKPLPTTATSTTTAPTTTTTSSVCAELSYESPAECSGDCMSAEWTGTQTYCRPDYELLLYSALGGTPTGGLLQCTGGQWYDGQTVIPDQVTVFCKPTATSTTTTSTTRGTTTTTSVCTKLPYGTPLSCSGCLSPEFNGSQMWCLDGYYLFSTDGNAASTAMGATLACADGQWYDGSTLVPEGTQMYCTQK